MKNVLRLGLPKGSLEESTKALFAKAGWKITTSTRSYRPSIDDPELDGRFIRAQEVSRYVEHGFFDIENPPFRGESAHEMLRALIDEVPSEMGKTEKIKTVWGRK